VRQRAQQIVVGIEARRRLAARALDLCLAERRLQRAHHALGDAILQVEHVLQGAIEPVGPQMRPCRCIDQLAGDANPVPGFSHAAFQHIADTQISRDLRDVHGATLVDEGRVAGDDDEFLETGERRDDVLDHAVGEVFLLGIAAHVLEGQHRDGGPVREAERHTGRQGTRDTRRCNGR
jgi:hypothetical protein